MMVGVGGVIVECLVRGLCVWWMFFMKQRQVIHVDSHCGCCVKFMRRTAPVCEQDDALELRAQRHNLLTWTRMTKSDD